MDKDGSNKGSHSETGILDSGEHRHICRSTPSGSYFRYKSSGDTQGPASKSQNSLRENKKIRSAHFDDLAIEERAAKQNTCAEEERTFVSIDHTPAAKDGGHQDSTKRKGCHRVS
mmetsp:Transcript_22767/g.41163  ORF Transcript_22767/g.41163 Transcript_22767/m.41163 type:complete len:115 (-) Transcript_22767:643-987(-)